MNPRQKRPPQPVPNNGPAPNETFVPLPRLGGSPAGRISGYGNNQDFSPYHNNAQGYSMQDNKKVAPPMYFPSFRESRPSFRNFRPAPPFVPAEPSISDQIPDRSIPPPYVERRAPLPSYESDLRNTKYGGGFGARYMPRNNGLRPHYDQPAPMANAYSANNKYSADAVRESSDEENSDFFKKEKVANSNDEKNNVAHEGQKSDYENAEDQKMNEDEKEEWLSTETYRFKYDMNSVRIEIPIIIAHFLNLIYNEDFNKTKVLENLIKTYFLSIIPIFRLNKEKQFESTKWFIDVPKNKKLIDFLTLVYMKTAENKGLARQLFLENIEKDQDLQMEFIRLLTACYETWRKSNSSANERLIIPDALPAICEILRCNIQIDDKVCESKQLNYKNPIKILQAPGEKEGEFIIYKSRIFNSRNHCYLESKTKEKIEINKLIMQIMLIKNSMMLKLKDSIEIDDKEIMMYQDKIKNLDISIASLRKLKKNAGKNTATRYMKMLENTLKNLYDESAKYINENKCVQKINKKIIDQNSQKVCMICSEYKSHKMLNLQCSHEFCTDCLSSSLNNASKKGKLPKCPLESCYYIIDQNDPVILENNYKYPAHDQVKTQCILCGSTSEGKKYDMYHAMCGKCMRNYIEVKTNGQLYTKQRYQKPMPCPIPKCADKNGYINEDLIRILYEDWELTCLKQRLEELNIKNG